MSVEIHARTCLLIGEEGLARLGASRVAVFGLGGVGSAAAEQLCRAGVGHLTVVDFDVIRPSNLNRQLLALHSTLGRAKADVMAERLTDVDPACRVDARVAFFAEETAESFGLEHHDYVLDCIDSLNPKVQLLRHCVSKGIAVVTAAGAAAKTDPLNVRVSDLFRTKNDPLARHVRRRLRGLGITSGIPAVHSEALPTRNRGAQAEEDYYRRGRARTPVGSISYLPPVFGCVMAGWVIRSLLGDPLPLGG
jgi:tRNA A37 threonylcarbamoyladenosine dehydratase